MPTNISFFSPISILHIASKEIPISLASYCLVIFLTNRNSFILRPLIEGFTSSEDKHVKMVRITPEGLACCRKAEANAQKVETDLTAALTDTERAILVSLLQKVRDSFS